MPYRVFTVVPSTIGRMSRCTPSRETSGPWPPSRPAILSISSRKMMPASSTRSMAMRVTWSMSMRRCSSSWMRYSKASLTFIFRFFVRWPKMLGSMSLMLTSISSTPWLEMISKDGKFRSRTSISTVRSSSLPSQLLAQFFAAAGIGIAGRGFESEAGLFRVRRGGGRQQNIEQAFFGIDFGLVGDILEFLGSDVVDRDLDQIADHRFHIAANIADFGKLRSFDFQERRIRQLCQAPGDFGFAHTGRADHDDVLGNDFFGQVGRKLLAAHAVAQGDRHGTLCVFLADNVLVELGDNFARSEFIQRELFFFCGSGEVNG